MLFVGAALRRAWMCDDAFITVRMVDHLVHGRGFVFNAAERVLGITNPLWALLLSAPYAWLGNPYLGPVLLGLLLSALAALLLLVTARERRLGALVLLALCFSRSFVDFSTSGLENPLSHLLLIASYTVALRTPERVGCLSLLVGLCLVNRADSACLALPPLFWALARVRPRWRALRAALFGLTPAIAWFGFALIYFGFPLPNTVYAKLNADIPRHELTRQGLSYLVDTVVNDPLTALFIGVALLVSLRGARREAAARVFSLALLADLVYVVLVGGDFMSGRFLTAATAVSAVALCHFGAHFAADTARLRVLALGLLGVVFSLSFSPFRDERALEPREFPTSRIVNERAWYHEHLLLGSNVRPVTWRDGALYKDGVLAREEKRRVVTAGNIGMFSMGAGPGVQVVDEFALTDPLLARIPFLYDANWRTGHLGRPVPAGYLKTLETGQNVIVDPCIARYYDQLGLVIRGPLFTRARWRAIWRLNSPGGLTVRACPTS